MKKITFSALLMMLTAPIFAHNPELVPTRTVFSENFETATFGIAPNDTIGGTKLSIWAPSVCIRSLEAETPISGGKSLKLNITAVGDYWSLQLNLTKASTALRPIDFKAGYKYKMTYKVKAAAPTTIIHYFQKSGNSDQQQNVSLVGGNVVETKTFITPIIGTSGDEGGFNWYWMLGSPGIATDIVIDDLVIEELGMPKTYVENFEAIVPDYLKVTDNLGMEFAANTGWTPGGAPYSNSTATWTNEIDAVNPISGSKSLKIDVPDTGNDYWSLQMRMRHLVSFVPGTDKIKISYKIRSVLPTTLVFQDGVSNAESTLSLVGGNVVETKEFISPITTGADQGTFLWNFGRPSVATTYWVDDIVIEAFNPLTTSTPKVGKNNLIANSVANQLFISTSNDTKLEVINLSGKTIMQRILNANETISLSVANSSGVLLVKATDILGNVTVQKVILK